MNMTKPKVIDSIRTDLVSRIWLLMKFIVKHIEVYAR